MILDRLTEWKRYAPLNPGFEAAFRFLEGAEALENGRYELENGVYANVSEVTTRPAESALFEAHRKYIDIQYYLGGRAKLGWAPTDALEPAGGFDAEKDCGFFSGEGRDIQVGEGDFYVLWPEDAHRPHETDGRTETFRVVVVKVPV